MLALQLLGEAGILIDPSSMIMGENRTCLQCDEYRNNMTSFDDTPWNGLLLLYSAHFS